MNKEECIFAAYIHVDFHVWLLNEPYHEKACFIYIRKQRPR